ncbi:MAG: 2-phospho-L-lactate transferase CofD family protein, partial [Chloroflexi bacterium]|nr:2-phospho-L-lactate transferase CofD family protein [Chloroflexota bacterium]
MTASRPRSRPRSRPIVLLAGGVGGARMAHGLQAHVGERLIVIVNTADDVERHGLLVSPDHDTVMYTLAGIDNREWGWGIAGETFAAAEMLERYGEETWFRLGDRDLATHIVRTARLRRGDRPTEIARDLQRSLGVRATILPMTDAAVRTQVLTDDGWLEFQDYFVRRHEEPEVRDIRFAGVEDARATPEVEA